MLIIRVLLTCLLLGMGFNNRQAAGQTAADESAPYVEREQKQFNFYPGGKLQVTAAAPGAVKIIGWQRASILVETERIVRGLPAEKAGELARQHTVQIRYDQTSCTIQTSRPPQLSAVVEVHLTLYVPREKTDIKVSIAKGDFSVEGINGWIEASMNDGNLEAKSLSGYFSAIMKRGNIHAEMSGKRWSGLEFSAATQAGTLQLQLPEAYSTALTLETRNGSMAVSYPDQIVDGQTVPLEIAIQKKASSLSAKIGEGGSPIRLMTMAGDASLSTSK